MPPFMLRTFLKPGLLQEIDRLARCARRSCSATTISAVRIEFGQALRQFAERNQRRARNAADLKFVRLAHVDQHELIAAIEFRFHFRGLDFARRCNRLGRGFMMRHAAELLIIDQLGDGADDRRRPGIPDSLRSFSSRNFMPSAS